MPERLRTKRMLKNVKMTTSAVWIKSFVWLNIGIISFASTFFYYELVIPYFERMIMTDFAFYFIDVLTFYLPSIICLLSAIACFTFVKVKDKLLYECVKRVVEDNMSAEERLRSEEYIDSILSNKWYHNFCPNCGAPASQALRSCSSCGSSLEVKSFEKEMPGAVHRIAANVIAKDDGTETKKEKDQ